MRFKDWKIFSKRSIFFLAVVSLFLFFSFGVFAASCKSFDGPSLWQTQDFDCDLTYQDSGGSGLKLCEYQIVSNGIDTGWITLDGNCSGNGPVSFSIQVTVGDLENCRDEGINKCKLETKATDNADNESGDTYYYNIDYNEPVALVTDPPAGSFQVPPSFDATFQYSDLGNGSQLDVCEYRVLSNGVETLTWISAGTCSGQGPVNLIKTITVDSGQNCRDLGTNTCRVEVRAQDIAGNEGFGFSEFNIAEPDFVLDVSPTSLRGPLVSGTSDPSTTITVTSVNGFNSAVSLSIRWCTSLTDTTCSQLVPSGLTSIFSASLITPPPDSSISSTLSIDTNDPSIGDYYFRIRGTSGSLTYDSDVLTLTIVDLLVDLSANPVSGAFPLNDVDLTAVVSGSAIDTINYKFDCTNDGIWDYTFNNITDNPKTIINACDYPLEGIYSVKVFVGRDAANPAEDTVDITVTECNSGDTRSQACGSGSCVGSQSQTCQAGGTWPATWSNCSGPTSSCGTISCPAGASGSCTRYCDGAGSCLSCTLSCTETNCSDGVDNDGDGSIDCADPNCLFSCDATAPRVDIFAIDGQAYPDTVFTNSALTITWTISDTGGSGIDHSEVWRGRDTTGDGNPDDWGIDPIIPSATSPESDNPSDGTWWYGVHVIDVAGNCISEDGSHCGGVTSDSLDPRTVRGPIKVIFDTTSSITTIKCNGTACLPVTDWYNADVAITLSCSDEGSNCDKTYYGINQPPDTEYLGEFYLQEDGTHEVKFYSRDNAGNPEGIRPQIIKIDKSPPGTEIKP